MTEAPVNLPFRVGTTSFVYPDRWLPNVERLAGRVQDIELLFFDIDGPGGSPGAEELHQLAKWKERADLSYTLHTPLDVSLASEDEGRRLVSVGKIRRAIELARPLDPSACVVHVDLTDREQGRPAVELGTWRRRAARSLTEILAGWNRPAELCVESLDYDFVLIEPVIEDLGLSVAIDLGHLRRDHRAEEELLRRNLHRTRVIHWHGVDPSGRDHRSLRFYPRERARWLLDTLIAEAYRGVLTLEVFRESDLEESLALLGTLLEDRNRSCESTANVASERAGSAQAKHDRATSDQSGPTARTAATVRKGVVR